MKLHYFNEQQFPIQCMDATEANVMAMQENNVIPLDSRAATSDRKKSQLLLDDCRDITLRYLPELLQRMLDNADDTLFEHANKADSNLLQASYFDAMRALRLQRKTVEDEFRVRIETGFNRFFCQPTTTTTTIPEFGDAATMMLVDESDLEESLATSTMIAKVKSRLAPELYAIEHRFAALAPGLTIDLDLIPIGPRAICEAFRDALKQFDVDTNIKLIIYKLFDKYVIANLEPLYDENNSLLAAAGVLANLKMSVKKQPRTPERTPPQTAPGDSSSVTASPTEQSLESGAGYQHSTDETLLGTLQQLLAQQRTTVTITPGNTTTTHHIQTIDLVNALSGIQHRDIRFEPFESVTQLKEVLSNEIQSAISAGKLALLSPVDNDIIDIVAMLFDFILDDHNLPPIAKALLSRLQIPLLKVAISDKEFFSKKQHPARQLLNQMAQSATGLDDEVRINSSPLLQKIDYIVNRILNDFQDNVALFDELLQEFGRFNGLTQQQERHTKEVSQKQYETREKHKLTSAWVMESIANRIKEKRLPKPVYELIVGPWREVMVQTYLNDGDEAMSWKEQLRFIDLLVWSVEPKSNEADKKRLANILIELIITLQDGLNSINLNPREIDHLLVALESCHIASIRGENSQTEIPRIRIKLDTSTTTTPPESELDQALAALQSQLQEMSQLEEMLNAPILDVDDINLSTTHPDVDHDEEIEEITISTATLRSKEQPTIDDEQWQRVVNLKAGEWINLQDENGKMQRIRLVWKSDYLSECTFTNWKFKIVAELSFNDLAARFRRGEASVIEELPLFERAIDAVMNRLHQRAIAAE